MKRNVPTVSLFAAALMVATLIPATIAAAAEPWLDEDFENGANGAFNSSGIHETGDGHQGDGIRVEIPKGEHWGTTTHWNTSSQPEEMWMRYWIKFPTGFRVDEPSRGKLPGFGGLYTYNCLGGRPSTSSQPCWSARLAFSPVMDGNLPDSPVDKSKVTQISFYAYLLNSSDVGQKGAILEWDPNKSTLRHDRWYCVEARVKMNDLGERNGVLEGYVDGSQAFAASNLNFRRASESHLKVKSLWFDVYYGGNATSPQNNRIYFDSVAAGPDRIGCNDSKGHDGTFYDDDGSVFEGAIEKLAASGITEGCNPPANDRFCPDDSVTRGQMSAFIKRALGDRFDVNLGDPPGSPPDFWGARTDVEYKAALDVYNDGGAPLDTYIVTYPIDETGTSKDWMRSGGSQTGDPNFWVPLQLERIWERGATPYIRIEVNDLPGLADGNHDTRLNRMLAAFASFVDQGDGRRVILDVLPEPNNDNYSYGDDPSRFKTSFRHVVEKARAELGDRVRTAFTGLNEMNSDRYSKTTWGAGGYRLFWPGGSYVDLAGVSGYDDRAGSNVGFYESAIDEMASAAGPGTPIIVSIGGAPANPSESAQMDYVAALADMAVSHDQVVGIQWEDRLRGSDDMRVSSSSGLQSGFAAASSAARNGGVDWLFSSAATDWSAARLAAIPFDDSTSSVFVNSIRWLAETGITQGCGPRQFCPDDAVTRGQMATFLSRALGLAAPPNHIEFDDTRGHVFEFAIAKLAHVGITVGCNPPDNDRFCPDSDVTRAQMAAFMVRAGITD